VWILFGDMDKKQWYILLGSCAGLGLLLLVAQGEGLKVIGTTLRMTGFIGLVILGGNDLYKMLILKGKKK